MKPQQNLFCFKILVWFQMEQDRNAKKNRLKKKDEQMKAKEEEDTG